MNELKQNRTTAPTGGMLDKTVKLKVKKISVCEIYESTIQTLPNDTKSSTCEN